MKYEIFAGKIREHCASWGIPAPCITHGRGDYELIDLCAHSDDHQVHDWMYAACTLMSDAQYTDSVLDIFLSFSTSWDLYLLGLQLPRGRYKPAILLTLLEKDNGDSLYYAGMDWPDSRYRPSIAYRLADLLYDEWLYRAGLDWPDSRFLPCLGRAMASLEHSEYVSYALKDWAEDRARYIRARRTSH